MVAFEEMGLDRLLAGTSEEELAGPLLADPARLTAMGVALHLHRRGR